MKTFSSRVTRALRRPAVLGFAFLAIIMFSKGAVFAGDLDGVGGYRFKVADQGGGGIEYGGGNAGGTSVDRYGVSGSFDSSFEQGGQPLRMERESFWKQPSALYMGLIRFARIMMWFR